VPPLPARGEIWDVDLQGPRGLEQRGRRPALVVSADRFNHGPAGLVIVLPLTSRDKGIPLHVAVTPPEGGVRVPSFVKPEDVRSVSRERLARRRGRVAGGTMRAVETSLRVLFEL
jgi:mRNA interferase MazF